MCPQLRCRTWCQGESQELFLMKEFTQQHFSPTPPGLAAHELHLYQRVTTS